MSYQPWLKNRIEKFNAFFADDTPGQILVILALWDMAVDYEALGIPDRPLDTWDFPTDAEAFAEHNVRHLRAGIELTRNIEDDRIPYVSPAIGIALNSVFYSGAPMIIGPDTSWVHPVIHDWDDLEGIRPDPANSWFQVISRINRRFVAMNAGDYAVQTFSHFAPMDMANALRGNQIFFDFYDAPDQVHALMQRCVEGIVWLEQEQRKIVPDVLGGTAIWGTWSPGPSLMMSEDAPDLCSPEIYREFGRPYTEQVAAAIGGCWIHHHALGMHVHGEVARVKGLRQTELSLDPNCPRPVDRLPQLFELNNGLPLMTRCYPRDVYEKIEEMKQGRLIIALSAGSLEEARETIAFVRKHSRI
jgi:hypothetical protein